MKAKTIFRVFLTAVFVFGTMAMNAQTKIYVYKTNGTATEFNIADIDSISFTPPATPADYSKLVLNEICGEHKFVEIYNSGTEEIPLAGVRLQRNDGPAAGGSEWLGKTSDVIPAGAYRIFLFNSFTPSLAENPAYTGWTVSSGISDQQILKVALLDPARETIDVFIRGDEPLPAWGTGGAERERDYSYSRMSDDTWAYAEPTPGAENGEKVKDIVNPGYIDVPVKINVLNGYVQKGPYVNGSSVVITLLDEYLNQTGNVFSTQIIDNSGNFERRNINFTSNFVELKADGYYFNEVKGENSGGPLTLYALADVTDVTSVNVNILTHLERQRIIYLIQNDDLSFSEAKKQARSEVLDIFKFTLPNNITTESLNIVDDALLLAVSAIIQGHLSTGDMSELLANISSDIRRDGRLDNPVLGSQLINNVAFLDLDQVISNMEKKYGGLGITMNINSSELKSYIEQFKNNCEFEQTLGITYPKTGKYGPNILADGFVDGKRLENGKLKDYSLIAELPAGNSAFTEYALSLPFSRGLKSTTSSAKIFGPYFPVLG